LSSTGDASVSALTALSRVVSHALRHEPWVYELELDDEGWTQVDGLISALREQGGEWSHVDRGDLERMIAAASKRRHEIRGDEIRALYGHSVPGRLAKESAAPPSVLFHGTSPAASRAILRDGLRPMGRQFVHLSIDVDTALQVGRRKADFPVVLRVDAAAAHAAGVCFCRGNELVWLADAVPLGFLTVGER
jgi:putative RNA 2'-phosphotransferase